MAPSFLFYDLETFGTDPRRTRIAQFAAIRTDWDLQPIEAPIDFFVKPADDLLPSPFATLVTGITPQQAWRDGVDEAEAFARINDAMSVPGTCAVGYNSLRFDDEFVRHGLFRNFHDPYAREWRGGNSRWDLLDVMRLAHALRPDGLQWPARPDGATSFRLEHLALANAVDTGTAHEALSDVRALIGIARALRSAQPKLWDYALRLRDKRHAASLLDPIAMTPVLHVSQRYPALRMCAAAVVPITMHPTIATRMIVFDLDGDPEPLLALDAQDIADRLYTPTADLPEGVTRIGLKEVHLNRSPSLVPWTFLRAPDLARLGIDDDAVQQRLARLRSFGPALAEKVRQVYATGRVHAPPDADAALYDGFIGDADRRRCDAVRSTPPEALAALRPGFDDPRLDELLFRYRARNWPALLDADAQSRWDDYRRLRIGSDSGLGEVDLDTFHAQIAALRVERADDGHVQVLLDQLQDWGNAIATTLGLEPR